MTHTNANEKVKQYGTNGMELYRRLESMVQLAYNNYASVHPKLAFCTREKLTSTVIYRPYCIVSLSSLTISKVNSDSIQEEKSMIVETAVL